ncbi:TetR/AcrR family transcriptional regulator [Phascolarctobacterium succinatutens]|uniref:TetR/AcrR family transcriptional regulator n=1 Tax=Phascolarctobacterium succinatutens TaxID=626940 RepID=UPI0026EDEE05|nr:TetR family transcriptional regulator [Phascolarctobacterium succinatutens]
MANEKRAQKKEQIIYTAIKMLEQSSYNDVRIEDIAQKLEVVKSNIFYYFPSKGILYLNVLEKLHSDIIERFILEVNQTSIKNIVDFKKLIMKLTDIYIRDYITLIKLSIESTRIFSECKREHILQYNNVVNILDDRLQSIIIEKFNGFTRNEIFYIFEVQEHFLRGYYQDMIQNAEYAIADDGDIAWERLSLYEFRVTRMLRFFLDGMIYEKDKNTLDK